MSQMHQMQLTYVSTEDRLLFRLNTKARQEFRFWMTRRYVMILWHSLNQLLAKEVAAAPVEPETEAAIPLHDPLVEAAKKEIKHQELVSQADFTTQYQESTYLPLGETPALLFSVGLKPSPDGQTLLCMHPEKGQGIEIALNEQILHSLCQLLIDTTTKADWRLNLAFLPRRTGEEPGKERPQGLN
jgi:hypothetical protein